jgi:hypothetical protein
MLITVSALGYNFAVSFAPDEGAEDELVEEHSEGIADVHDLAGEQQLCDTPAATPTGFTWTTPGS